MVIAGIDYSTRAVDVVLLDEDTDAAEWHRFDLEGHDAFERTRSVRWALPTASFWDDVLAVGIEDPRGYNAGSLYRIQGAILASIQPPRRLLVQPWIPSQWRKTVGLPGNASKTDVFTFVAKTSGYALPWLDCDDKACPQDAVDAYCLALATRSLLQRTEAA